MSNEFQYDVFVSHNAKDKPRVRRLAKRLKQAGLRVWFDEWNVAAGDIIALKVDEGLEQSRVLLLCISPNALASGWVAQERSTAIHRDPANAGRRFIPLLLANCELPDTLRRYKYVDFREEVDAAIDELITICSGRDFKSVTADGDARLGLRPLNLGFDGAVDSGYPHAWFDSLGYVDGVSTDYDVQVVKRDDGRPGRCLMLRKAEAGFREFASVMQRFPARHLAGKAVHFEGELRTQDVSGWSGLWLRADGDQEANLFFDNMSGHGVRGTTPWARHAIDGRLPVHTTWLNIGIVFSGSGITWADNLTLRVWTPESKWEEV